MKKYSMDRRDFLRTGTAAVSATLAGKAVAVDADTAQHAASKERAQEMKVILWCWDARMTWDDEPEAIARKMAAAEQAFPYLKQPEAYLVGGKRLIDYCSKIGVDGVILWGFLRDCHGGVAAAQELCRYASDKGVAILPGVGLCAYGGYYFEGDHRFNLGSYLRKHPERASEAHEEHSDRTVAPVLDPALEANQQWWRDGLEWMLETFEVGGVDFEMGDFIVNPSSQAKQAREALSFAANGNILDTVVATQDLLERAFEWMPEGIFINSTYRGYHQIAGFPRMPYLDAVPQRTVWQYTLRNMVRQDAFPQGFLGAPEHRKYGYLHWFNPSTDTTEKDYVPEIARVFPGLHRLGFEFAGTYGEISARANPLADRNYRAQVAWARNPELTLDAFG